MDKFQKAYEQFKVQGRELVDKIGELIHEGNVRRIIIRDEHGHTFMEIPLTIAAIGVVAAPILAAVGGLAALVARFELVVERAGPQKGAAEATTGATEDEVNLAETTPQHMDEHGTAAEDVAGTGKHDSLGG